MKLEFGNPEHIALKKKAENEAEEKTQLKKYKVTRERNITEEAEVEATSEEDAKELAYDLGDWEIIDEEADTMSFCHVELIKNE